MTTPATTAAKTTGIWEDFVDIFYAPSQVFERRRAGQFGLALAILTVLMTVVFFVTKGGLQPVMDAEFQRKAAEAMAKNPKLTMEQMEKGRAMFEKFGFLAVLVGTPLRVCIVALLLWVGGKLAGATGPLAPAMMVSTYAHVPRVLESLLAGVQGLLLNPDSITSRYSVTLSAARFLDPTTTNPMLLRLAGQVDVFSIWVAVLLALGLSVVGRIPRGRAAAVAAVIWIVGALFG
ncbi:MAG: YIP1 family protein [Gemmatimonadaceae bacterium]